MIINMNDKVKVRLSDFGRQVHKQWVQTTMGGKFKFEPRAQDDEGWSEWSVWELMQTFGPFMRMGMPQVPFVDNEIKVPDSPGPDPLLRGV